MLAPKRILHRKVQRGSMKGQAKGNTELHFGEFGIQALEAHWITNRQIEAARIAMTRYMKRGGRVYITIFPDKPITKKPAETRMGSGKGNPEEWVAVVKPGRIMFEVKGVKVAFVGVCTPETFTKSTPTYFQDANGNYIYGFCEGNNGADLYKAVQKAIDAAKAAGADYVIGLGHLGIDEQSSPWMSKEVIANTTGFDAFIDGHSHSTFSETIKDKSGKEVVFEQTGTKLANVGKLTIKTDGTITHENVDLNTVEPDAEAAAYIQTITDKFDALQKQVVAKTSVELTINGADGKRAVRNAETNLGDLCADAYRILLGADIAFVNGGGVRDNIKVGDITYGDIIKVHPFGNEACLVEVTGQQIKDALELGSAAYPGESGGFLQVSGLTYTINADIPSSEER